VARWLLKRKARPRCAGNAARGDRGNAQGTIKTNFRMNNNGYFAFSKFTAMTERELRKLEAMIRGKMEEIKKQRVSLKDSGIGGLMNTLKKVDEALYEKILPEYKKMVTDYNLFK
jgi:hypothetical protein